MQRRSCHVLAARPIASLSSAKAKQRLKTTPSDLLEPHPAANETDPSGDLVRGTDGSIPGSSASARQKSLCKWVGCMPSPIFPRRRAGKAYLALRRSGEAAPALAEEPD